MLEWVLVAAAVYLGCGALFVGFAMFESWRDGEFVFDWRADFVVIILGLLVWPLIIWDEIKRGLGK